MEATAFAVIGAAQIAALVYLIRSHAAERRFLVNTAISRTSSEFALRQQFTDQPAKPSEEEAEPEQFPDGI